MSNIKFKKLLLPAVIALLTGCNSDSDSGGNGNNQAPVLNKDALSVDYSTVYESDEESGQIEWDFSFKESDETFVGENGGTVDYYMIDLLQGIEDPDGDLLSIEDINFIWVGPDCSNFTSRQDYPETCEPILAEFDLTLEDSTTWEQDQEIKKYQNLPVVVDPIYGFELNQRSIKVTPNKFAPILSTDQTAQIAMVYTVSDGENSLERRIKIEVMGENAAPIFIQQNEFGEPILDTDGNEQIVEAPAVSVSEKSGKVKVDLIYGIYDRDMAAVDELEKEVGNLANIYDEETDHYTREIINVHSFTPPSDILSGVYEPVGGGYREGIGQFRYEYTFDPSPYQDVLARGETKDLVFSYMVSDGENDVERTFTLTIIGANEKNEPLFDEANFTKTIANIENIKLVDLAEGAYDLDGDPMSVVDFMPQAGSEDQYGLDLSTVLENRAIKIDPYAFTNLKPGESQEFTYTYKLSDGELTSVERTFTIEIMGTTANLLMQGTNSDPGLESGSLADSPFSWQWSPNGADFLEINTDSARTGSYGLESKEANVFIKLNAAGFKEHALSKNETAYFNYWTMPPTAWGSTTFTFNADYDYANKFGISSIPDKGAVANTWVEHTLDITNKTFDQDVLNEKIYDPNAVFDITLQTNARKFDDFSMIKYTYSKDRDLITNGEFSQGTDGGWTTNGTATLEVSDEANRVQGTDDVQYGLILNGGTNGGEVTLDASVFPQNKFKTGVRYIAQLDLKHPTYVATSSDGDGPQPIFVRVRGDNNNMSQNRVYTQKSATAWNTYYLHINNQSEAEYDYGKINADTSFDWLSSTNTSFSIWIPANHTYWIDNIKFYPVPQH